MRDIWPWVQLILVRRVRLAVGALLMALTIAGGIGLLALSGWFITATGLTALLWASGTRTPFDVYIPGGGIRFFALTRTLSRYAERLYNHDTVLRLLADLRTAHFSAMSKLDAATLARWRSAQWLNRLTADIDALDNLYLRLLAPPLVALLGVVGISLLIGWYQPRSALWVAAALIALLMLNTLGVAWWTRRLGASQVERVDTLRSEAVEHVQGLAELTAAGARLSHQSRLLRISAASLAEEQGLRGRTALVQAASTVVMQGAALGVLFGALLAYRDGALSGPVAVMLTLAVMGLAEAFAGLPAAFAMFGATRRAAQRLNEQRRVQSSLVDPGGAAAPSAGLPDLSFEDVCVAHAGIQALTLMVEPGERLAIIGPSGCGKSTLADLAARLIDPDHGRLCSGGVSLRDLSLDSWRERVGYLTQRTELMHDSIAANLWLARPDASFERLWSVLELVELGDAVEGFADGILTWAGESGRQLSGGEARRVALARVLLKDSPFVILDEPFSGLDEATAERIRNNLEPWLAGRTVLMFAHAAEALPHADRQLSWSQLNRR
ncbi:ATP-binding cassette, subfamily C, CydC [Halopseudomonas xinjiangensis]|uniref:ATP-binding cassette, subfamily C, CydC n=1 Tax=Halopseudomonas xinjiangensis TaxID=487184 RepID=A0A1H1YXJ4_9GAMM|nr:thiol reductant ABC exporter subunit CydC [Halopseudomonas xinjiangensis]SDT26160.1 ATP-binding cassette, subfamily C, CydC [Halopseudomonas xinjiangensis]